MPMPWSLTLIATEPFCRNVDTSISFFSGEYFIALVRRLTEASINLLTNAMKYSPEKKEIEVSTFRQNGSVAIRVKDHGIGIASAELEHIFEPFYRTHGGKETGAGGTGLGLALVKHIVEA